MSEDIKESRSALLASGLWLRVGTVGAFGLVGVLHQLFIGEMQPLSGLALTAAAGLLVVMSWWRARVVLDRDDEADEATSAAPVPAKNAISGSVA
jgi:hypothetical protein